MRALSIAATGMQAQQTNVEIIANNLANMNTTGFKEQRAEFEDLLYQNVQTPAPRPPTRHLRAQRHPARRRRQTAADLSHHYPGRSCSPPAILMTSRSRARASFASSRPTAPTPIPAPAISRCRPRASSSPRTAWWSSPASPSLPTPSASPSTPRARSTPPCPATPRPRPWASWNWTVFPNEAGLNAVGSNLFLETPASGTPQAGVPGSHRLRHHPAGLSGNLQRQFGGRDHRPDHRPARL